MAVPEPTPEYDEIVTDLRRVREGGIGRLRGQEFPALLRSARLVDGVEVDSNQPAAITALLRAAVDRFGGGSLQEAAELLLGLAPGTALWSSKMRREEAAERYGVTYETFRKKPERELLGQIAEVILEFCHDGALRAARLQMERRRHPADSRLAVQWVERFEAYNRLWTPAYALAANLEAALDTYLEEPQDHLPWNPNSARAYDPIEAARDYARSALYNLGQFLLELKRFKSRHGGMWLMSDSETETDVSDAVYRIGWHNDLTYDQESFLRRQLADSRHEEQDHFWAVFAALPEGLRIHDQWQDMVKAGVGMSSTDEKARSQVWLTIAACQDYMRIVDEDWVKIADWYRPGTQPRRGVSGKELYDDLLGRASS
ncbi:hypothetical protein [Demequina sp.]|uniref:hypothetical protein n=1 Tax=Demequina sp. TaxID=2050685 RepID=UPI003A83F66A